MVIQSSLLPEEKIFEANAIARATWRTNSVWVQRIAAILINKINPNDENFSPAMVPFHEIIGSKGGMSYTAIRELISDLMSQHVIIRVPDTKKDIISHHIFNSGIRYYEKKNCLKICLNPALKPYYLELKSHFVAYGLTEFLSLPSNYHQSLYKYLKSWESEQNHCADINELHRILGSSKTNLTNYAALNRRVLAPAHKFINERTTLKYDYEPQKVGRKVVSVVFTFKSNPKIKKAPPKTKKATPKTRR